jgi:hypothetical protein
LGEKVMDKKLQTTIAAVLTVLLVGGGIFFGITQAKKGAKCPFCGKYFPHGEIMGHKLRCPENDTDLTPRSGTEAPS